MTSTTPASAISISTSFTLWGRFSRSPLARLSRTTGSCPAAKRVSTRWLPIKPAPPVTSITLRSLRSFIRGVARARTICCSGPGYSPSFYVCYRPDVRVATPNPKQREIDATATALSLSRSYAKGSNTGEPPQHQATHSRVDHRLTAFARSLVVLAQPPAKRKPADGSFGHQAPR